MSFWDGSPRLDGVCVLVVEDVPHVREVVVEALSLCGARVIAVDSATKGLIVLKRERPDVLVSSLAMPDHDGYWLIRQVRSLPSMDGGSTWGPVQQLGSPNGQVASDVVLGEAWRVRADGRLIAELGDWLAPQNVQLMYAPA